jgi:Raf kinase inhibitor-like YbhB/YbcL family protein
MLTISSPAFGHGTSIPKKYSQEGDNVSPPLQWQGIPGGTRELVLICEDPDAPMPESVIHWLLFALKPGVNSLPGAIPLGKQLTAPLMVQQGLNSSGDPGYMGPMPPKGHGEHRYFFRLFALDISLGLDGGVEGGVGKELLVERMQGHVIAVAELIGMYQRGRPRALKHPETSLQI